MSKVRDLEKLRKEYKNDYIPTEEDLKIIEEQKETGKIIESSFLRERELRNNPEKYPLDDYTKILYRLPITEEQREIIYNNLIQQTKNLK